MNETYLQGFSLHDPAQSQPDSCRPSSAVDFRSSFGNHFAPKWLRLKSCSQLLLDCVSCRAWGTSSTSGLISGIMCSHIDRDSPREFGLLNAILYWSPGGFWARRKEWVDCEHSSHLAKFSIPTKSKRIPCRHHWAEWLVFWEKSCGFCKNANKTV